MPTFPNDPRYTKREKILDEAKGYVLNDRNKSYGEPDEDFQRIAAIASAMGFRTLKTVHRPDGDTSEFMPLTGSDVARFMIALKLSRLSWMPDHHDSWADIIGYGACGFETAMLEKGRKQAEAQIPISQAVGPTDGVKMAARQAVNGYPDNLEKLGYVLMDTPEAQGRPDICKGGHNFSAGCIYRIHLRRVDR